MSWTSEGYRVFWTDDGDADDFCELCFGRIPPEELESGDGPYDSMFAPHVYITADMEVDAPLHCNFCHRPIKHALTTDGVDYVMQAIREFTYENTVAGGYFGTHRKLGSHHYARIGACLGWYEGSPGYELLMDWAEAVSWYGPDNDDERTIEIFYDSIEQVEGTLAFALYWKAQWFMDRTTRPIRDFMNSRYESVMEDIVQYRDA